MWIAYAKNEAAARELERDMLSRHVGPIVWVAWEMSATWVPLNAPDDAGSGHRTNPCSSRDSVT